MVQRSDIRGRLLPEMRAVLAKSEQLYAGLGPQPDDPIAAARTAYDAERRFWNAEPAPVAETRDQTIGTALGPLPTRLHRPSLEPSTGLAIYLHGGGYVLGGLDTHDRITRLLARGSGFPVLSVDYGLSPEHKFPAALDQIAALLDSLAARRVHADVGSDAIVLAGDSAGAHLSLGTAIGRPDRRLRGLVLYYGAFGLRDSAARRLYGSEIDGLSPDQLAFYRDAYLRDPADQRDPRYDCLAAELAGLPPCFIGAVELDPLRDDSLALAEALKLSGVAHRLVRYDGVLHGFLHYSRMLPLAGQALDEGADFIKERLTAA